MYLITLALAAGVVIFFMAQKNSQPEHVVQMPFQNISLPSWSSLSQKIFVPSVIHPAPTTNAPTPAAPPLLWGAYVGDTLSNAAHFETLIGRTMDMQAIFVGWGKDETFPFEYGAAVRDKHKTLVLFWEQTGTTLDSIIAGDSDAYIKSFAADARTYRGPIILVPFHEMNDDEISWSGAYGSNTPDKVIDAWRHVHNFFSDVPNVKFAWDVNSNSVPDTAENAITKYYPGDAYVDVVAVDGFNFGTPWVSFAQIFDAPLATLKQYHKPIYILSMASAEGPEKAAWITDAFTNILAHHPEVAGWVWFNVSKEADWRVNSDDASLAAFVHALPKQ